MKKKLALACVLSVFFSMSAWGDSFSPWSVSSGVGTTGIYLVTQYRSSAYLTTNAEISGFDTHIHFSAGGERYGLQARLLSGLITEHWHPWGSGFYISAGMLINGNRFSLKPSLNNTGSHDLATPANVSFRPVSPYMGFGYSQRFSRHSHWSFNMSAGAVYQGCSIISVTHGIGVHPQWEQHAYTSEVSSLQHALNGFHWYPVAEFGVSYRFD